MNSSENQNIKRKFVENEVVYCVSYLISEMYKLQEHLDYQDQEALYNIQSTPNYESAVDYSSDTCHVIYSNCYEGFVWVDKEKHQISRRFDTEYEAYKMCCEENNIDYDYIESLEFWVVSEFLARKLKENNEMVEEFMGLTIWGRCCSGQAILLDNVISEICYGMEILKGQKYEWKI